MPGHARKNFYSKAFFITVFTILFSLPVIGQEDDNTCPQPEDKKAIKLYQQGSDRKKYEKAERMNFLRKALEIAPDYNEANFLLAEEIIRTAKYEGTSYKPALPYLESIRSNCPDFNTYVYFYLGQISYGEKKFSEAAGYFEKFLEDVDAIKRDADYNLATELLDISKEYHEIYEKSVPFEPKCLEGVNTPDDEYLPIISPDDELIFFTRRVWEKPMYDVAWAEPKQVEYFSSGQRRANTFEKGRRLAPPFNVGDHYGGATVTPDNKHLYITVCKPFRGYVNCDIYTSTLVNGRWDSLIQMGPQINTEDGWESQPSISADGNTLYFSGLRKDSKGMDIYRTQKLPDGTWGPAENLGAPVNTDQNEKSPFLHSDSQTLYFSSDGHTGMGGYDIFMSRSDSSGKWKKPKNLGYPINNIEDEVGFFVSTDGRYGYFASNTLEGPECTGGYDIYYFDLYKEARPEKVLLIKGEVDTKAEILRETSVQITNIETKKVTNVNVDTADGKYVTIVSAPKNEDFVVTVKKPGSAITSHLISSDDYKNVGKVSLKTELKEIKAGESYRINDIIYETGSAAIKKSSLSILDELALFMKENNRMKIAIYGHTDDVGDDASNLTLSTERAFNVMEYLQSKGISKDRLSFKGFGETMPVVPNTNDTNRAVNRRTEFKVISF